MPYRILIVDDEPDMLRLITMILREKASEYIVTTTNNPVEALELAKQGGFDLVLSDLKMPGLDGLELLTSLRKFDPDVPVIIITAFATAEAAAEAMQKNAFDFISKPSRKEQILFTIDKALRWLTTQRENRMLREKLGGTGV
jgi:DNA-binding NtrC family response regulator